MLINYVIRQSVSSFRLSVRRFVKYDRLCGLVVRILGYTSGGPGSIPGLERGPLSLVSTTEELLDRKVAVPV
jgi:hypothetical protein